MYLSKPLAFLFMLVLAFQVMAIEDASPEPAPEPLKRKKKIESCKNGYYEIYERGKLMKGNYLESVKVGVWTKTDKKGRLIYKEIYDTLGNGQLITCMIYKKGQKYSGKFMQLEPDEDNPTQYLETFGLVEYGQKAGKWITYYPKSKKIKEITHYKNGVRHGIYEKYDKYGNILKRGIYQKGMKHGKFQHYKRWNYFHKEPVIHREYNYIEDQLHGNFKSYLNNNRILTSGTFFQNQMHGEWLFHRKEKIRINHFNKGILDGLQDYFLGDTLAARYELNNGKLMQIHKTPGDEVILSDSFSNGNGSIRFKEINLHHFLYNTGALSKTASNMLFKDDLYSGRLSFTNGRVKNGKYRLNALFAKKDLELEVNNNNFLLYDNNNFFKQRQLVKFSETIDLVFQRMCKPCKEVSALEYFSLEQIIKEDSIIEITQTKDSTYSLRSKKKFMYDSQVKYTIYPKHLVRRGMDSDSSLYYENFNLKQIRLYPVNGKDYVVYQFVNKYKNIEGTEDIYWNPELGIINNFFTSWGDLLSLQTSSVNNKSVILVLNRALMRDKQFYGWKKK